MKDISGYKYTSENKIAGLDTLIDDFTIFMNTDFIDLTAESTYIDHGIIGICLEGSLNLNISQYEHRIGRRDLIVVLPGQTMSLKEKSADMKVCHFHISQSLINDVLSGIFRFSPLFFIHMRKKHLYNLTEDEYMRYWAYYKLIDSRLNEIDSRYNREYIINIVKLIYLDLYGNYENRVLAINQNSIDNRKEKLTYDFFLLIMNHYKTEREVAFYANKLSITPKYLSAVVKEISNRCAKDWITEYILLEIRSLLENRSFNIQQIAIMTNFSNQTSLGRFFKKHTGISPSKYRMNKI